MYQFQVWAEGHPARYLGVESGRSFVDAVYRLADRDSKFKSEFNEAELTHRGAALHPTAREAEAA